MHDTAKEFGRLFFETYCQGFDEGRVVEIGSQDVNGTLRDSAPARLTYVGVDFVEGKGVDVILSDPYALPFEDASAEVIVSSSCFEHSEMFWLVFLEMARILKPGGLIYINVPSNGMFHRYPVDCWRFYPDSGSALSAWAKRNGQPLSLLESFVGKQVSRNDRWNDFVAVFVKGEQFSSRYPRRIVDQVDGCLNAKTFGTETLRNEQVLPEDQELVLSLERQLHRQLEQQLEHKLTQLHEERTRLEAAVTATNLENIQLQTAADSCRVELERLSGSLAQAADELARMKQTRVWRWTGPMRTLKANVANWGAEPIPWAYVCKKEIYRLLRRHDKVAKYDEKLRAWKSSRGI